ncbi:hypothetical protein [Chryseobacterium sp. JM1]|uniref:hypothetical protein n=1 Tax=Chryseobacterium sp. JM1 TaxID=1233950 RepID=UPI0004E703A5|nr:hypothetical protein [Chryseobacterium sp. JM1]KFF18983.1 hypothetical protein IW22_17450 [Chryseobacterium sp. JM1]
MKKLLLFPLLMVVSTVSAQKIEVSASYGAPSVYGATYSLGSVLVNAFVNSSEEDPSSKGVASVGVMMYSGNMKWRYGIDVTNEFFSKTESVSKQNIWAVLPKVDYFWLNKEKLGLYSGLSAGISIVNTTYTGKDKKESKDSDTGFGYNIVPVGLKYGGDLSVFLETNIGMKGIVQGGVSYRF